MQFRHRRIGLEGLSEGKVLRGVDALRLEQIVLHVGYLSYTISIGEVRTRGGLTCGEIRSVYGNGRCLFLLGSFGSGCCSEGEERGEQPKQNDEFS